MYVCMYVCVYGTSTLLRSTSRLCHKSKRNKQTNKINDDEKRKTQITNNNSSPWIYQVYETGRKIKMEKKRYKKQMKREMRHPSPTDDHETVNVGVGG